MMSTPDSTSKRLGNAAFHCPKATPGFLSVFHGLNRNSTMWGKHPASVGGHTALVLHSTGRGSTG